MRSTENFTITGGDVARFYETGWEWWHFAITFVLVAALCLVLAYALPIFAATYGALEESRLRWPALVVMGAAAIFALFWVMGQPGAMMRHSPTVGGAVWIGIGCLVIGVVAWAIPAMNQDPAYRPRAYALPVALMVAGVAIAGINELLTRSASMIPTSVGTLVAGIVLVGFLILFGKK